MRTYTKKEILELQAGNAATLAHMLLNGEPLKTYLPKINYILLLDAEINSVRFNGYDMDKLIEIKWPQSK